MSVPIEVSVQLNSASARAGLTELDRVLRKIAEKKYTAKIEAAGADIAATQIANLTSSAAKFDAQLKASEAAAKRFSAALKSQMEAEQADEAATDGLRSKMNVLDQAIAESESASRAFAAALKQQMMDEKEAAAAADKESEAERKLAGSLRESEEAAGGAGKAISTLNVFLGNIASRAFHLVISKITQAFREAFETMKAMDTQLINISKVSGITGDELAAIGDRAFDTAKKYGVAVDEYLSAVYTFQKAGLGQSAEAMGELAVKTMLVGDTTADVASQFLISANAAWQFGGDMERLGQIIDEADYINNNYATDLGKLSSGLPRVASVAAQAGMSAEETLAALGVITAVTQESGTKAATALRALILNIEGQVGEFVDDTGESFTVTEESVKSMQGLMEKYAKAELEAAKASGELINPLTAIRAIFEGMANSDLNDQELFTLLSGMGGKLRTNQLTALVQNYEMLDEMLGRIAGSAGTADSEISLMMDSWERQAQNLKTTFTWFVQDMVDSGVIKQAIGYLDDFIVRLDDAFHNVREFFGVEFENADEIKKKYADLQGEYDDLLSREKELTAWEQRRLDALRLILQLMDEEAEKQGKKNAEDWLDKNSRMWLQTSSGYKAGYDLNYSALEETFQSLGTQLGEGEIDIAEYTEGMKGLVAQFSNYYDGLIKAREAGAELNETELDFIRDFEGVAAVAASQIGGIEDYNDAYRMVLDTQGNVIALIKKKETAERDAAEEAEAAADATREAWEQILTPIENALNFIYDPLYRLAEVAETTAQAQYAAEQARNQAEALYELAEATAEVTAAREAYEQAGIAYANAQSPEERAAAYDALKQAELDYYNTLSDTVSGLSEAGEAEIAYATALTEAQNRLDEARQKARDAKEAWLAGTGTKADFNAANAELTAAQNAYDALIAQAEELTSETGDAAGAASDVSDAAGDIDFDPALAGAEALTRALLAADAAASGISVPALGGGFATGTTNAPGGPTLVNELGPELISENGRAYIANGGRPGIVNLSRGAIVLPAGVTKEALRGGNKGRFIDAAAGGTSLLPLGGTQAGYTPPETTAGGARDFVIDPGRQAAMNAAAEYNSPWECPKCGTINPGGYYKCSKCGTLKNGKRNPTSGGGGSGGGKKKGSGLTKKQAQKLADELSDLLSNLDKQAKLANNQGDYVKEAQLYEQAQEAIKKMVENYRKAGYSDDSDEILDLLNKNYDYANKQLSLYQSKWDELIKALEADTDAQEMANKLAEKQQAVDDAREALANAQRQRTIRMYNAATGQWEWVADSKKISSAEDKLTSAEDAYAKELKSQAITELKNAKEAGLALEDIVLGPALSAVALMAEETDEFQNFARALNAVYGVGSFLQSTEGSTKVIPTTDSHDINYTFGNVTLTEEEASSMSVAELARKLSVLNIS